MSNQFSKFCLIINSKKIARLVNSSNSEFLQKKGTKKISYLILVINLTSEPMSESKKRGKEKQFVRIAYTKYVMYEFNLS